MVKPEEVRVGGIFEYPHPDGVGTVETTVVCIFRSTPMYPQGRVQHESIQICLGAVVPMEDFCAHAVKTKEP